MNLNSTVKWSVASVMPTDFASITTINFPVAEGKWVFPQVELFNDCGHIHDINGKNGLSLKKTGSNLFN